MSPLLRSGLLVAALMISAPVIAWVLTPTKSISDIATHIDMEAVIPTSFGNWHISETAVKQIPTAEQEQTLNSIYSQIVTRTYVSDQGETVMLSVAYGSKQSKQLRAHRQEVCYAAQGFKIEQLQHVTLEIKDTGVPATQMIARMGQRSEPVTYWFTMGNRVVRSLMDRELTQLKYAATGYLPDGYLFRISTISRDTDKAFVTQRQFISELFAVLDNQLASKLIGSK